MPGGPLRVGALYVSGLFVIFYVVIIAQFVWVCEMNEELNSAGYVLPWVSLRILLILLWSVFTQHSTVYNQETSAHSSNNRRVGSLSLISFHFVMLKSYMQWQWYPTLCSSFSLCEPSAS
jgi:NADH:ubiquinone oxidoreductase subunit 6 (subunit J)